MEQTADAPRAPMTLEDRELTEDAARHWWLFLVSGLAWLIFALLVFQWNYTTVYAISYLFGVVVLFAAVGEFTQVGVSTTGWKVVHVLLGILFVVGGIWALVHPHQAFSTIAALIGFFFLFKGIVDVMSALMTRKLFEFWWLQLTVGIIEILLAFWVAGHFRNKVILLVAYVGIMALARGITDLILGFKLKGLRSS